MKVEVIHQRLGVNPLYKEINNVLSAARFRKLRVLVAYVSWQGLGLIHEQLEAFYDRGNKISMIFGIGGNGGEIDVLRYLKQRFNSAHFAIFHASDTNYIFHPKVYIFSNQLNSLVLIGSNNLTNGGLFGNTECCIKLLIDNAVDSNVLRAINEIWEAYSNPNDLPPKKWTQRRVGVSINTGS